MFYASICWINGRANIFIFIKPKVNKKVNLILIGKSVNLQKKKNCNIFFKSLKFLFIFLTNWEYVVWSNILRLSYLLFKNFISFIEKLLFKRKKKRKRRNIDVQKIKFIFKIKTKLLKQKKYFITLISLYIFNDTKHC